MSLSTFGYKPIEKPMNLTMVILLILHIHLIQNIYPTKKEKIENMLGKKFSQQNILLRIYKNKVCPVNSSMVNLSQVNYLQLNSEFNHCF